MTLSVSLRIDVDTYVGARDGVPALLVELARRGVKASFFLSLGPDTAGRAALRVFTRPGFFSKMLRTRAVSTYGLRTVLSGTLLPATRIGAACQAIYREVAAAGHEVAVHAWDHFRWQDHLRRWSCAEVLEEYVRAFDEFERIFGHRPRATAAPGWVASWASLEAQGELPLDYASDVRGRGPFRPVLPGRTRRTLQVPVTLPTFDEVVGRDGVEAGDWNEHLLARIGHQGRHVYALHAEVEGRGQRARFGALLDALRDRGAAHPTLGEVARSASSAPEPPPTCLVIWRPIDGRAGEVACQGPAATAGGAEGRSP